MSKDICRRQVGRRHVLSRRHTGVRRHVPRTGRAQTRVVAKTHGCAKTLHEDRSGKDTCRYEMLRRYMGARRHFPKTGQGKTCVVAKTHGCAKTNSKPHQKSKFPKSEPQTQIPRDSPPPLTIPEPGHQVEKGSKFLLGESYILLTCFSSRCHTDWGFGDFGVQGLGLARACEPPGHTCIAAPEVGCLWMSFVRQKLTWRREGRWRHPMCRQNGVTNTRGVTKTRGVTECGVRTQRHEDMWCHRMWRQNAAS